jgi:hypothetical protein
MKIDEQTARDIAAYLYTLKSERSGYFWNEGE